MRTGGCLDLGRIEWIERYRQPVQVARHGETVVIKVVIIFIIIENKTKRHI